MVEAWSHQKRIDAVLLSGIVVLVIILRIIFPAHIADDSYITLKGVCNMLSGGGLSVNYGRPVFAITTPLYALLIAFLNLIGFSLKASVSTLGIVFESASAIALFHLVRSVCKSSYAGFLAAALLLTNSVFLFTSYSGMETALYVFLLLLAFILLGKERYGLAMIVSALAVWTRIDGLVVTAVVAITWLWRTKPDGLRKAVILLPGLSMIIGYIIFALLYYGTPVPMSLIAKMQEGAIGLDHSPSIALYFLQPIIGISGYWYSTPNIVVMLLTPFIMVGAYSLARMKDLVPYALFCILYCGCFIASGSAYALNFPWYFLPPLPFFFALMSAGLLAITKKATSPLLIMAFIVIICSFSPLADNERSLATVESEREQVYASLALDLVEAFGADTTLAASEIGAISFVVPKETQVIDLVGLTREKEDRGIDYVRLVKEKRPSAIITRWEDDPFKRNISRALPRDYAWSKFKTVNVGIRNDLTGKVGDVSFAERYDSGEPLREIVCR